ncbi:hypothetical protein V8E53_004197, partial [Lactarius tabidus]
VALGGNGDLYAALRHPLPSIGRSLSLLTDLETRMELVYSVNNGLVGVADPIVVGHGISKQVDCAPNVVPKAHADEDIGITVRYGAKFIVARPTEIFTEKIVAHCNAVTGGLLLRA